MKYYCKCGHEFERMGAIGRSETCDACDADLHACVQCKFHDPNVNNECQEPNTDPIKDRERGNFCDFFRAQTNPSNTANSSNHFSSTNAAKAKLDALFKK